MALQKVQMLESLFRMNRLKEEALLRAAAGTGRLSGTVEVTQLDPLLPADRHAHSLLCLSFWEARCLWQLSQALCVLEVGVGNLGMSVNCRFKKSSIVRVRNLGGLKGYVDVGESPSPLSTWSSPPWDLFQKVTIQQLTGDRKLSDRPPSLANSDMPLRFPCPSIIYPMLIGAGTGYAMKTGANHTGTYLSDKLHSFTKYSKTPIDGKRLLKERLDTIGRSKPRRSIPGRVESREERCRHLLIKEPREPTRAKQVMEQRRNARAGETGNPRENLLTSAIIRNDFHARKSESDLAGIRTRFALVVGYRSSHFTTKAPQTPSAGGLSRCAATLVFSSRLWGYGDAAARALALHLDGLVSTTGGVAPRIFALGNRAGRCRWLVGFLGDLPFPSPCIPVLLHTHLALPSSTLKTPLLKAVMISITSESTEAPPCDAASTSPDVGRLRPGLATPRVSGISLHVFLIGSTQADKWRSRRNERAGETGDPREDPPTNGIVRHDSHMRKSGVTRPGIDPGSPSWEASRLTAQSPKTCTYLLRVGIYYKDACSCGPMLVPCAFISLLSHVDHIVETCAPPTRHCFHNFRSRDLPLCDKPQSERPQVLDDEALEEDLVSLPTASRCLVKQPDFPCTA
ncbi:hypothetical protein PR048_009223 [Dryococelus australis]|uniref:Uncharacterized protein n=1 Tax=Dryococelus australis TaxID=614101 RepID=A0ABQ9HZ98_9NEOP|nr:hypothetical protein PR048_009223 [Dryococelus australis]